MSPSSRSNTSRSFIPLNSVFSMIVALVVPSATACVTSSLNVSCVRVTSGAGNCRPLPFTQGIGDRGFEVVILPLRITLGRSLVGITADRAAADFLILHECQAGGTFGGNRNNIAVFGKDDLLVYAECTTQLANTIKDLCASGILSTVAPAPDAGTVECDPGQIPPVPSYMRHGCSGPQQSQAAQRLADPGRNAVRSREWGCACPQEHPFRSPFWLPHSDFHSSSVLNYL